MNPHAPAPVSLWSLAASLRRNRDLILQLARREVVGRYKGSVMGLFWSLLNPVLLLTLYTFFFSVVLRARWGGGGTADKGEFAVLVFVGMIVHGLFSECLLRAPTLVVGNVPYVKKIVFPLEVLPVVTLGASLFHAAVSLGVLALAQLLVFNRLPWTWVFAPLVLAPLLVMALGVAWALASLGVFFRDIAQPIGFLATVLLFASPVFYPISSLPQVLQPWLMLNPLTFIIEQARAALVEGRLPDFGGLALYTLVALACAWAGYAWFQKTRKGFANVL